jgi:16S rRNA (guanine966-N2)-methyltransferase
MQIITGKYKNLKIKGIDAIPSTKGIVRHAIFNILGSKIINASFLDIFGGTGIIGFEALSRGARNVSICETEKKHFNLIKKNAAHLKIPEDAENFQVYLKDAFSLKVNYNKIDIVFSDAPYEEIGINVNLINHIKKNKGSLKKILYIVESNEQESKFINDHLDCISNYESDENYMSNLHNEFAISKNEPRKYGKSFLQFLEI